MKGSVPSFEHVSGIWSVTIMKWLGVGWVLVQDIHGKSGRHFGSCSACKVSSAMPPSVQ